MQISALDYNSYVGVIGVGRITRGAIKPTLKSLLLIAMVNPQRKSTASYGLLRP